MELILLELDRLKERKLVGLRIHGPGSRTVAFLGYIRVQLE